MTVTPGLLDLIVYQGATFRKLITWTAEDTLVNLTGWSARMQLRSRHTSTTVLASLTTENSKIILGGAAGTVDLNLTAAETAALTRTKGVYDLEMIDPNGVVIRLLEGSFTLKKEVTR
jgi:hypothetical protein